MSAPRTRWLLALPPLVLLAGIVVLYLSVDPLGPLGVEAPPVEELTVERTVLDEEGIHLRVRANGSQPVRIAQVQVDAAYWEFTQDPAGPIPRLRAVWLDLPYMWVEGETHHITMVTNTGVTFGHTIDVATTTPPATWTRFLAFALLGLYVGVVPVGLGLLFYPWLKTLGEQGIRFLLALTVGLLVFLLADTMLEALELAAQAAPGLEIGVLVWLAAAAAFLLLLSIGRRSGRPPEGMALSVYLALGIGLHNLGEGMAIGAAFAVGEAALGSFLVVGFTLHNITEGIGIAAPLVERRTRLASFAGLAALAGLPAVAGTWAGAFAFSPHIAAVCLGIGAGAILQVVVEVGSWLSRRAAAAGTGWLSPLTFSGFAAGLVVMYGTALLVSF